MTREELEKHLPQLYEDAQRFAERWLASRGGHDVDSHAIAADAIVRLIEHPEKIKDPHNLRRHLFFLIQNMVINSLRRISRRKLPEPQLDDIADPNVQRMSDQELIDMASAVRSLPEHQRAVIEMSIEGANIQEIAESLGKSESFVRRNYSQAMKALRLAMPEHGLIPANLRTTQVESSQPVACPKNSLSIVLDAEISRDLVAEFLAELSKFYAELSGGDELVIREGKIPAEIGVLV